MHVFYFIWYFYIICLCVYAKDSLAQHMTRLRMPRVVEFDDV
jgi:hypothetical protein